jgi:hypothetical protein
MAERHEPSKHSTGAAAEHVGRVESTVNKPLPELPPVLVPVEPVPEPPMTPEPDDDGQSARVALQTPDGHNTGEVTGHDRIGHKSADATHDKSGQRTFSHLALA